MNAVMLSAPIVIVVTASFGASAASRQRHRLRRPELERDAAGQEDRVEEIEFQESLGTDQRGIHAQVDRRAAGVYFVADRIELAVLVGVRGLDRVEVGRGLEARVELVEHFLDGQDPRRRAADVEQQDQFLNGI